MGERLSQYLKDMVGKTFMYETHLHRILSYEIQDGICTVVTDKKWIKFPESRGLKKLREFLEAPDEEKQELALKILPKNGELTDLKKILVENIKRVQNDEKFVQQANAINKSVNAVINLGKLEISFFKAQREEL